MSQKLLCVLMVVLFLGASAQTSKQKAKGTHYTCIYVEGTFEQRLGGPKALKVAQADAWKFNSANKDSPSKYLAVFSVEKGCPRTLKISR